MHVNEAEANRVGLTPQKIADAAMGALLGSPAGEVHLEDRSIGVRVRAPDTVRFNRLQLNALPIVSSQTGAPVPLGTLATFQPVETRAELLRENHQQMIAMTADVSGRSLGSVMNDVKAAIAGNAPPAGIRMELGGQYASQPGCVSWLACWSSRSPPPASWPIMVLQFQSSSSRSSFCSRRRFRSSARSGLLLLTGTPLNVSSFMGLILLVGLVVKNGIILLDFTRHRMLADGLPLEKAITEAARVRLRPILMTTLCTLFGLLPLALGLGAGSELQKPLALAVIGGLTLSTPITLFVVPTLLVAIRGRDYKLVPSSTAIAST